MCSHCVGGYQGLLVYSVCRCEQLTSDGFLSAQIHSNLHILATQHHPPPSPLLNKKLGEL